MTADAHEVLVDGPWRHRFVAANGAQFHVAEAGRGPLVVLLHTAGQLWWAWHRQIPALADSGLRVAALDLRGAGASDRPPLGYDTATLTADVAGVVRALGESEAVVVGHGAGGWVSWAMPALQPQVTRAIGVLSMGHPLTMRALMLNPVHRRLTSALVAARVPWLPEHRLRRTDIGSLMRQGWGEGEPDEADLQIYRRSMRLPSAAHTTMEYLRTLPVLGGHRLWRRSTADLVRALQAPVTVPVLQMHGAEDPWVSVRAAALSRARVDGPLNAQMLSGAGHYLPEEAPTAVTVALMEWLGGLALRPAERPNSPRDRQG